MSNSKSPLTLPNAPLRAHPFYLRQWEPGDADWYVSARDEEIFKWTTEPRHLSPSTVRDVITANRAHPTWIGLAICDLETGTLVGNISLVPAADGSAEVMYWVAANARRRGAASRAVQALCSWAFEVLQTKRIFLKTDRSNVASQAVARQCGFSTVGTVDEGDLLFVLGRTGATT